ncbi:hypothetical protein D3C75_1192720 [compost metagenome]
MASIVRGASTSRISGKRWRMNSPEMLPWVSASSLPAMSSSVLGLSGATRVTSTDGLFRNERVNRN